MHIGIHRNIHFVFSQLVEASKQSGEKTLIERKEKLMLELQKLKARVDEFNDYGELDMMQQYVADVRAVQKRLADCVTEIEWVHAEELLYKYPTSKYPEVDEITNAVDPFLRLFQVRGSWGVNVKKIEILPLIYSFVNRI